MASGSMYVVVMSTQFYDVLACVFVISVKVWPIYVSRNKRSYVVCCFTKSYLISSHRMYLTPRECVSDKPHSVFYETKTYESGVTKGTTGEVWSAFSWHHSSISSHLRVCLQHTWKAQVKGHVTQIQTKMVSNIENHCDVVYDITMAHP